MGHAEMGWGGLCRGRVGCIMQGCGGLDHAGMGWGSCRGGVGHEGWMGWVMQGWGGVGWGGS